MTEYIRYDTVTEEIVDLSKEDFIHEIESICLFNKTRIDSLFKAVNSGDSINLGEYHYWIEE